MQPSSRMDDHMHVASGRLRALPRSCAAVAAALLALAPWTADAPAAGSTQVAEGLHLSAGALADPHGRIWISDHNAGFCRVTDVTADGPGHIEHPQRPAEGGPRTCLGALLPDAEPGPDPAGS